MMTDHRPAAEARRAPVSETRHAPVSEARHAPAAETRRAPASEARHDPAAEVWPPALVPTDQPRRPGSAARCTAVETVGLEARSVRDSVLAAAFAALLHRYTGQDRIALAGPDGEVRFQVTGETTLRDLAEGATTAHATGTCPVGFTAGAAPSADGAPFELRLVVHGEKAELHYDAELFEHTTALRLLDHYRTLLVDGLRHPDRTVNRLRLLGDEELRRTLVEWNRTETELPNQGCLHEAFEARADSAPEAVAVVHGDERLTYRQVNAAANRLAHHLRSLGVGPDLRVGLCLDRSAQLLVAELAVLKAGGAYVPLDPDYPAQRIAAMVAGTSCTVMISREELTGNLPEGGEQSPPLVLLDRDADVLARLPEHNPGRVADPDHLCYIIHTSGSTGAPKPIALHHRGVLNNIADLNSRYGVGPGDGVLALSSPSFDMSVYEFLGLTIAGGTVIVPDAGRTKDPGHWAELLVAEDVTVWNSAPALLNLLTDHLEQTGAEPLPRLRLALLGGDWVPVTLPDRVRAVAPDLRFVVMGGATESSIHSTIHEVDKVDPDWTSIPYGRPMANQRTYILDDALQPVPPGVPGELYLAGTGLARGYLDQPERTAERFLDWSYGDVVRGERLYRTGDAARFGQDGLIELIGRKDFQVKIHGLRVELGEIETVLRSHPGVRQSVVVARSNRLVAYVVPEDTDSDAVGGTVDTAALLSLAADRLPEYMVPSAVVALERLPLTPNGKLDRLGLPEPEFTTAAYRAPGSAEEKILAAVYAEVLGVDRVGADDDFLAAGGDSIRAIQVVTRARARGLEVTPRQILQCRTVAALAQAATGADAGAAAYAASAPLADPDSAEFRAWQRRYPGLSDIWPLTSLQSGILFESTLSDTGYDAYQMQTVFHLSGEVDPARMRAAGQALLDRYANLRVAFVPDADDNLVQLVLDGVELPWREVDLGTVPDARRDEAFRRFLAEDYATHFDRTTPPLLRLTLVRFGPARYELVLTTHHVLIDGWSEPILTQDLLRLYASDGDASGLPAVREFRDFLAWLNRQDRAGTARVWADELAGVDEPTLLAPAGATRAEVPGSGDVAPGDTGSGDIGSGDIWSGDTGAGDAGSREVLAREIGLTLTEEESGRLFRRASELGVTVNTLVQGVWAVLLSGLTGREDVVFGATVSGRPASLPGVESMVGLFINTLPVRVRCAPGDTVADLLTGLQGRQSVLLDHHHLGLADIHQETGLDALFDTLVAFQSYPMDHVGIAEASAAAGIEVTGVDAEGAANYPLALIVETDPSVRLSLQYHRDVFTQDAVDDIAVRLHEVLHQFLADPARRVGTVDVLLPDERQLITAGQPGADVASAEQTLPALVERRATSTPDAVAVVSEGVALSYRELNTWANRLAHQLIRRGVGPESMVALALPRSVQLAVALLGTLKSGAAFVLGEPGDTPVRVAEVVRGPELDQLGTQPSYPGDNANPTDRDRRASLDPGHLAWLRRPYRGDGGPAEVAVDHRALVDGASRFVSAAGLAPGTRMLAASPHDDAMLFEVVAALSCGACVKIPTEINSFGRDWGWTGDVISTVAPFYAEVLNRSAGAIYAGTVVLTGDTLPGSLVRRIREATPGARVVGVYGPAETFTATAFTASDAADAEARNRPLGTPLGNVRARVLDAALRPVPAGVPGELYIAGEVARGHRGRSGPTAERFVADPYGPDGARMYRTGDLARWNRDGTLEYVGPCGPQALVRGRRISTVDVTAALAAHPGVSHAAAVVREGEGADGEGLLVGYVAPLRTGAGVDAEELREFVARRLPDHLVPATVVPLDELPLAGDGTVDRHALPAPGAEPVGGGYRKGRTPQEEALCELVADVLGVDRVGIDDDFFTLRCNSLKATRIIGRMRRTLGLEVSIRVLFQHPTVAELSEHLKPATTKTRPSLGNALRRGIKRDPEGPAALARQIRDDMKEQVPQMRENAKEQAAQLKEQLTTQAREKWSGDEFQTKVMEDVNERIRDGVQRGSGGPKGGGKDAKESQKLLKRMLERFDEEVRDATQHRALTDERLAQLQEILAATADSVRGLLREVPEKAG
ncbi:non-ribosomal peptide synthetase [Streptomyces sporangiiformans]|uniref:Amino acid adenylation domain-containing protein n=1 Tax=Streptomyces sporangiiformans TaxID=2315329 RepID=A0A505D5D7_9ACTN|nr:non-ribosomal peptide synthetase [Streptomyces sporangiiformans]TPQ17472.1 amino acid adenylation domain-containing protein [Streptomyces sporangiiformans]